MFEFLKAKKVCDCDERMKKLEGNIVALTSEKADLTEQVEKLKLKKKIEDEDIKHMVKMKEEKLDLKHKTEQVERDQEKEKAIAEVKDKYRDKIEANLTTQKDDVKEMYNEILKRLPDVNVRLKGDIGK